ncbi:hypothetical protein I3760_04G025200 [Carya illinoinensis]|uniref:PWWP domain-containing protein n=1 Tax=Carya illinoinensis TaxID=32201 RepID=A0A8T1QPS3_CARIL|nr:uncharacterized protein LOC122307200 [Carya illinoinensis]KAG2710404.1 hypothetical protein I3760_04G025200 [Carya illinoinensis]KAG2710405.1 hypothetical protein I3760_04G025200 [Carya illinoinensis]KAG6656487.1 hypothetical protein CIPAW_04G026000 [Carya illinoinensis]
MGTVETRSKTLAGGSRPAAEPAIPHLSPEKPLKESLGVSAGSGSVPERTLLNGDMVAGVVQVVKTRGVETEVSSKDEYGLEDSDMRGVSSLLKLKASVRKFEVEDGSENERESVEEKRDLVEKFGSEENDGSSSDNEEDSDGKIEAIEVPIEDTSENDDGKAEEDMVDDGYNFSVGDFVWGKIRSHPWWPGQVYDPSDASDYAVKFKVRDRLLVAYFGDGTFAWCQPSQLKPFEENFEEMSRQSNSKSFVYAVQRAVDAIGRLLGLELTCSCVTNQNGNGIDNRVLVANAGIKDGVLLPEGRIGKLSNIWSQPVDLLAEMKRIAQTLSIHGALGLGVLKSRLAAFYHAKGHYHLPMYHEPQPIPGLEDNLDYSIVGIRSTVEVPIHGPFTEDWISSPVSPKFGQTAQTTMQKCLGNSEDRLCQRRKQKSIAEIMEGSIDAQAKCKVWDVAKVGANSAKTVPLSRRKKRKNSDQTDGHGGNDVTSVTTSLKKAKMLGPLSDGKAPSVENDDSWNREETRKSPRRKKNYGVSVEIADDRGKELINNEPASTKRELKNVEVQISDGEAKGQIEIGFMSRERKKSKYLSPPFTSLIRVQQRKEKETGSLEVSDEARLGEQIIAGSPPIQKCNDKIFLKKLSEEIDLGCEPSDISSPRTPKQDRTSIMDPLKVKASANEVLSEVRRAALNPLNLMEKKSFEMVEGFLSVLRSLVYRDGSDSNAEKKHQSGRKRKNLDSVPGSLNNDRNDTNNKSTGHVSELRMRKKNQEAESDEAKPKRVAEKQWTGKRNKEAQPHENKPKSVTEETDARRNNKAELHEAKRVRAAEKQRTEKKNKEAESYDKSEPKRTSEKQDAGRNDKAELCEAKPKRAAKKPDAKLDKSKQADGTPDNTDRKGSPAVPLLSLTFGPESSLPSKANLVRIYRKFGMLNEAETEVFSNNFCARVAFVRSSDAEEAYSHSLHSNPFKDATVTFDLQYPSTQLKTRELREIALPKASPPFYGKTPEKTSSSPQLQLDFVRQKLEIMNSMLENSDGEVSLELKYKLESEIKGLLESVSTMVGSSSS